MLKDTSEKSECVTSKLTCLDLMNCESWRRHFEELVFLLSNNIYSLFKKQKKSMRLCIEVINEQKPSLLKMNKRKKLEP